LAICLTVILKLDVTVFIVYIFRHYDRNDLIFVSHFKNNLVHNQNISKKSWV